MEQWNCELDLLANVAAQVRTLAKARLSANRMLVELVENSIAAESGNRKRFSTSPSGSGTGRMVFGN